MDEHITSSQWQALSAKLSNFGGPMEWIIGLAIAFIAGFVIGLLLKYSFKYVIFALLLVMGMVWFLEQVHIVTINYTALQPITDVTNKITVGDLIGTIWYWVSTHKAVSISFIFGLFTAW